MAVSRGQPPKTANFQGCREIAGLGEPDPSRPDEPVVQAVGSSRLQSTQACGEGRTGELGQDRGLVGLQPRLSVLWLPVG